MKILTKNFISEKYLIDKTCKGSIDYELYTEKKEIENIHEKISDKLDLIQTFNVNIYAIHAPINEGYDIENLISDFNKIEDVFFYANEIGKLQNRKIVIILHMNYDIRTYDILKVTYEIVNKIKILLDIYKNTTVAIENLMPICYDKNNMCTKTNFKNEVVEFVEYFNDNTSYKIGTVLDTCHALATIELLEQFRGTIPDKDIPTINNYIENYIKTLKVVHLSYYKRLGIGKDNHGILFEGKGDDIRVLTKIVKYLHNAGYNGLITLEVTEDDYSNTRNWVITKDNLNKVLMCLNISDKSL